MSDRRLLMIAQSSALALGGLAALAAAIVVWSGPGNAGGPGVEGRLVAVGLIVLTLAGLAGGLLCFWKGEAVLRDSIGGLWRQAEAARAKVGHGPRAAETVGREEREGPAALSTLLRELDEGIDDLVEERHQREREVMRADQLAMVGQIAAGIAHEIRNPLTAIKMLVQAGRKEGIEESLPAEDLEIIEHEIRRMERCLQRFLDFARPPKPERRPLDPRPVIERVLALVDTRARKQQVTLRFSPPAVPVIVEADEDQMQQLIMNLVLNALDVMPAGGSLDVSLDVPSDSEIELHVADSGPGIPVELLPRLFDPFISTKETGIGLGLAVSFRIAERHGGSLTAVNRPEGGACFTMRLPCVRPASVTR